MDVKCWATLCTMYTGCVVRLSWYQVGQLDEHKETCNPAGGLAVDWSEDQLAWLRSIESAIWEGLGLVNTIDLLYMNITNFAQFIYVNILVYILHIACQTCQSQGVSTIFAYDVPFFQLEVLSLISFTLHDHWGDINHYTIHQINQAIHILLYYHGQRHTTCYIVKQPLLLVIHT